MINEERIQNDDNEKKLMNYKLKERGNYELIKQRTAKTIG